MSNYVGHIDHWAEFAERFEKLEDKDDIEFVVMFTSSASSGGGMGALTFDELKAYVERRNVPVVFCTMPHVVVYPRPKTPQFFER